MIIIFSEKNDRSSSSVIRQLHHLGEEVVRINSDDDRYKFDKITSEGIFFRNTQTDVQINLLQARSCWWRRTGISQRNFHSVSAKKKLVADELDLSPFISGPRSLLKSETRDLKQYIFSKVYRNCQINIGSPWTFSLNKLQVLDIASKKGLRTPPYEIVSRLDQIAQSNTIGDQFVSKAIADGLYNSIDHHHFYSYTELLQKDLFSQSATTHIFPSLIMELVEKSFEIRSFFLDGCFYSMSIFSQKSAQTQVDFRKYNEAKPNKCEPFSLPGKIEEKLRAVFSELDLNCGSVDMIVDKNGEYVFLEINPVGQYGMLNEPCNYNLDHLIANYLTHGWTRKN